MAAPGSAGRVALIAIGLCGMTVAIGAQSLTARAAVSTDAIEAGVPFVLQVTIDGSDATPEVELPSLAGASVRPLSAGPSNSQSITIINGRRTTRVQRRFVLSYELLAVAAGPLAIPAIELTVEGQRLSTQPFAVSVVVPPSSEHYRLRTTAAVERAWVGQPIALTTTWMWPEDPVDEFIPRRLYSFTHPVIDSPAFDVAIPTPPGQAVKLAVSGKEIWATEPVLRQVDKGYDGLAFDLILVPREPGSLQVPAATVAFEGIASLRIRRDRFGRPMRDIRRVVVVSEPLELSVEPLPAAGRPADFSGLVGSFELIAAATPVDAKVGDPITLEVTVSGSGDLSRLAALDLTHLDDAGDFRVAAQRVERSPGRFPSQATFRTTIRALHAAVAAVPPVRLSYFDPDRGAYAEASSAAIPLDVQAARQVTLRDVEGGDGPQAGAEGLAAAAAGIAHNYEGDLLLRRQRFAVAAFVASPGGVILLAAGPLAVGIAGLLLRLRRRVAAAPAARGALARLQRALSPEASEASALAPALHDYLRARLAMAGTPGPELLARALRERGVDPQRIAELHEILDRLDASRYGAAAESAEVLRNRILRWAEAVEPVLARGGTR